VHSPRGTLCSAGGFAVVKVAKPQQDMRFDVPTIGIGTLKTMAAAGGKVLAVEAGRTIIIDEAQVVAFANHNKMVVVASTSRASKAPPESSVTANCHRVHSGLRGKGNSPSAFRK